MGDVSSILSAASAGTTTAGTGTSSASGAAGLASNFNTFLTLLTTQLQNQDPTNPVDSNQFTQQLVEFAGVQQQVQGNSYLQQILATTQNNQLASASSYIGTTIQATGDEGYLPSSGNGEFGYTLSGQATNAQVAIYDSSGNLVFTGNGSTNAGTNLVTWDGKNSITGTQEPAGTYYIKVSATDASGNAITATPFITGKVTSASLNSGSLVLSIGSLYVPISTVEAVTGIGATTAVTSSGSGSSGSSGSGAS